MVASGVSNGHRSAGDVGIAMYIIISGSLSVEEKLESGETKSRVLGAGQFLGEEIVLGFAEVVTFTKRAPNGAGGCRPRSARVPQGPGP